MYQRHAPSTKARREGYAQLHKLKRFLSKLLYPGLIGVRPSLDEEHWLETEFSKIGWRDYMIRHTPALKRGGPSEQKPGKSKRRRQKQADRNSQVRSGLRR